MTFKLLDSTVGTISFITNDDIPRLRLDDLDDEEKFRMKKKAAGALLKVSFCLHVARIKLGFFPGREGLTQYQIFFKKNVFL